MQYVYSWLTTVLLYKIKQLQNNKLKPPVNDETFGFANHLYLFIYLISKT